MHASVTGALAGIPDELARAMGVPDEFFAARDRILQAAARGRLLRGRNERTGRRIPAVPAHDPLRGHRSGVPHQGVQVVRVGGRARRRLPGGRPLARPTTRLCRSSWCRRARRASRSSPPGTRSGMRATSSHDVHLDVDVPADCLLGGVEGLALLVAQVMPHWMVASYAAVYVGVAQSCVDEAVEHCRARNLAGLPLGAVPPRPGRRRGGGRPPGRGGGGPPGRRGAGRAGDQPVGVAGEATWPARRRWTWRRPCWRRPARRRYPARASAGTAVPGRAVRLAAAGHIGRVRRLARYRDARRGSRR